MRKLSIIWSIGVLFCVALAADEYQQKPIEANNAERVTQDHLLQLGAGERLFLSGLPQTVTSTELLPNGDFEDGPVIWTEVSLNGWDLILPAGSLLVPPHSGSWAVWLGRLR